MENQLRVFGTADLITQILDYLADIRILSVNKYILSIIKKHNDYIVYWNKYGLNRSDICRYGISAELFIDPSYVCPATNPKNPFRECNNAPGSTIAYLRATYGNP